MQITHRNCGLLLVERQREISLANDITWNDDENFEKTLKKVFSSENKMAVLNHEKFTLATDDTIEELQNGAKNINTAKYVVSVNRVEGAVRRKEHSYENRGTRTGWTK